MQRMVGFSVNVFFRCYVTDTWFQRHVFFFAGSMNGWFQCHVSFAGVKLPSVSCLLQGLCSE